MGAWRKLAFLALAVAAAAAQPAGPFERAVAALNQGDFQAARDTLLPYVEKAPNDGRALLALAQAHRALDEPDLAEARLDKVAELAPRQPVLFRGLSMYWEAAGEPDRAAEYEAFYARAFPGDDSALGRAAALYLDAGHAANAVEFARSALARGESAALQNLLGKAYAAAGRDDEAEKALREAIRLRPYDEDLRYDLGYFHLEAQRFEEALAAFDEGRKTFAKSSRLALGAGIAQYGLRNFSGAVAAFLDASRYDPALPQAHYFLGRTLAHAADRIDEVVAVQRAFAEARPDDYLGPFLLGQALVAALPPDAGAEAVETAERALRRSIELKGDFWESQFELGALLDEQRRFAEARPFLERAVELHPKASKLHYRLARVYARLGERELAAREREIHAELTEAERSEEGMSGPREEPLLP